MLPILGPPLDKHHVWHMPLAQVDRLICMHGLNLPSPVVLMTGLGFVSQWCGSFGQGCLHTQQLLPFQQPVLQAPVCRPPVPGAAAHRHLARQKNPANTDKISMSPGLMEEVCSRAQQNADEIASRPILR